MPAPREVRDRQAEWTRVTMRLGMGRLLEFHPDHDAVAKQFERRFTGSVNPEKQTHPML
jgi:hypothetical protein